MNYLVNNHLGGYYISDNVTDNLKEKVKKKGAYSSVRNYYYSKLWYKKVKKYFFILMSYISDLLLYLVYL